MPLKPICFVVMPFGKKETGVEGDEKPARVDFDILWSKAIKPAIESLNYRAVRADEDRGALIIIEMIERLMYSDLVVADMSIANANVYYEVGLRHAARTNGCVLIGADWAKPVFDIDQMRRISYPNATERIDDSAAQKIIDSLTRGIPHAAESESPPQLIRSRYPDPTQQQRRAQELAETLDEIETLYQEMQSILERPETERKQAAANFIRKHPAEQVHSAYLASMILPFVRDALEDWQKTIAYIDSLPEAIRNSSFVQEQHALASSKDGDHHGAISELRKLINLAGPTPERLGLLGGRYKKLYRESVEAGKPHRPYLDKAISNYEAGMQLDLNEYYCSCNLPALYRNRNEEGDQDRAIAVAAAARLACERARLRGSNDPWLPPTLLGLAFSEGNLAAAETLSLEVARKTGINWHLDTTLSDLRAHVAHHSLCNPQLGDALECLLISHIEVVH
jgi:tetratricopeptide (TPR) repeat protein